MFTSSSSSLDGMTTASLTSLTSINANAVIVGTDHGEIVQKDIFDRAGAGGGLIGGGGSEGGGGGSGSGGSGSGGNGGSSGGGSGGGSSEGGDNGGDDSSSSSSSSSLMAVGDFLTVGSSPLIFVARNPFVDKLTLAVSGGEFSIWKDGINVPLVASPPSPNAITACSWSPTRASVIILARSGGNVEVWSIIERANEPVLSHTFSPHGIVSLFVSKPLPLSVGGGLRDPQLLCLGDESGRMSVVEMPLSLSAPSRTERKLLEMFIEHETQRIKESRRKEEEEKEKERLLKERRMIKDHKMPATAQGSGAKRGGGYGDSDKEDEEEESNRLPPKKKDAQGQFVYDMDDFVVWECLGQLDEETIPPEVNVDFFATIEGPEEKEEREKAEREKLKAKKQ